MNGELTPNRHSTDAPNCLSTDKVFTFRSAKRGILQLDSEYRMQARAGEQMSFTSKDVDISASTSLDLSAGDAFALNSGAQDTTLLP